MAWATPGLGLSPGFSRVLKVKMDSMSVLQSREKEPIYTRKTKHQVTLLKATSQDIGFLVFVFVFL